MMKEVFKWIPGYTGFFKVSNYGRVISVDRIVNNGSVCGRLVKGRQFKLTKKPNGYLSVMLSKHGKDKRYLVHRLVLKTFVGESDLSVNHIDCNKQNNKLNNLEYCNHKQNIDHAFKNNLIKNFGETHYRSKLNSKQVLEIYNSDKSMKELSIQYGVSRGCIHGIKTGVNWRRITSDKNNNASFCSQKERKENTY